MDSVDLSVLKTLLGWQAGELPLWLVTVVESTSLMELLMKLLAIPLSPKVRGKRLVIAMTRLSNNASQVIGYDGGEVGIQSLS